MDNTTAEVTRTISLQTLVPKPTMFCDEVRVQRQHAAVLKLLTKHHFFNNSNFRLLCFDSF